MADETVWKGSVSMRYLLFSLGTWLTLGFFLVHQRMKYTYVITDARVRRSEGIFSRNDSSVNLRDIRNVQLQQGPIQRLLGYGDVSFSTAGTGDVEIRFGKVSRPRRVKQMVEDAQAEQMEATID